VRCEQTVHAYSVGADGTVRERRRATAFLQEVAGRVGQLFFVRWSRQPPGATLFPYTTLFRSDRGSRAFHTASCCRSARFSSARSDRKSTRLNSSHVSISYAVLCLEKKRKV